MNILRPATEAFPVVDQLLQERLGRTSSQPEKLPKCVALSLICCIADTPGFTSNGIFQPRQSVMPFGFEHDDGWFDIIDVLSGLLGAARCAGDAGEGKVCDAPLLLPR